MTQKQALSILQTGANVFLTGEPGSGKTYVVNQYVKYLREHDIAVAVTASTGIAATHLGGMTIHSWSGVGIHSQLTAHDLAKLQLKPHLNKRINKTNVLIIDEVSMLDAKLISLVDQAIQKIRDNDAPFGGLQVVFVGDFFQLPPVHHENEDVKFAFHSPSWKSAKPVVCYLTEQHRQSDQKLTALLQAIRNGTHSSHNYQTLMSRQVDIERDSTLTRLYSHNINVDQLNHRKLQGLKGEVFSFEMISRGKKVFVEQLKKGCLSPEILVLKKGAQVMFTKNNYEQGYVNGTLGEVIKFQDGAPIVMTKDGTHIVVTPIEWSIEENNKTLASIAQLPLRLAWAITVHKSQGMTLDAAIIDLSRAFEYGQGYVAISRVKSLFGLFLIGLNQMALSVHPEIMDMDTVFQQQSEKMVNFLTSYTQAQIEKKHETFINRCDGSIKKIHIIKKPIKIEGATYEETLSLYVQGKSVVEIAQKRSLKTETIITHLERLKHGNKLNSEDFHRIIPEKLTKALAEISKAFAKSEDKRLGAVFYELNEAYTYEELRLARLVCD